MKSGKERRYLAIDEDGNRLACPWCGAEIDVIRLSREEAQFALGNVLFTPGSRRLLSFNNEDDPLAWMEEAAQWIARHVSGDHGHIDKQDKEFNQLGMEVIDGKAHGRILSAYNVNGEALWIVTERSRTVTTVLVPEEYQ